MNTIEISFTREEVFLQLRQDGGRATSPDSPVCHFDFSCVFFHKEVKVVVKDLMFIYMPFADLSFKVSIILYNLLRETKRFISRKEE